jgi:hypothetical protein
MVLMAENHSYSESSLVLLITSCRYSVDMHVRRTGVQCTPASAASHVTRSAGSSQIESTPDPPDRPIDPTVRMSMESCMP